MSIKGCELEIQIDGSVKAKTHPSLFNRAVDYYEGDVERAMELYGVSLTDEFKELGIENPSLQQLITFLINLKENRPLLIRIYKVLSTLLYLIKRSMKFKTNL